MHLLVILTAKYAIAFPALIALVAFFIMPRSWRRPYLIALVMGLPLAYLFAKIAGHYYYDARPFVVGNFTPLIPHAADNGFPSDHTLLASALAAAVFLFHKPLGICSFVIAALIGAARVFAGVHHTIDVIGSMAIAIVALFIVSRLMRWFMMPSRSQR